MAEIKFGIDLELERLQGKYGARFRVWFVHKAVGPTSWCAMHHGAPRSEKVTDSVAELEEWLEGQS